MKPNEFDDLIRRKFDQNEFEYNPSNWSRLEDKMDKKATRRKILMWLPLAPVAYISSVAASLAMIITIPVLMHNNSKSELAQHSAVAQRTQKNIIADKVEQNNITSITVQETIIDNKHNKINIAVDEKASKISFSAIALATDLMNNDMHGNDDKGHNYNYAFSGSDFVYGSYEERKARRSGSSTFSVIGGFNSGSSMSGYSIGANYKKMLSGKVFIEGDVAFVDNSGIQNKLDPSYNGSSSAFMVATAIYPQRVQDNSISVQNTFSDIAAPVVSSQISPSAGGGKPGTVSNAIVSNARIAADPTADAQKPTAPTPAMPDIHRVKYDLYYGQFAPAVGYHLHKNLAVGIGADVQRLLQGETNMSTSTSATTMSDINADTKLVPGFDVGLVGKTEVAFSNRVKASVYYRQGMNNVITPGNKYIDRSYLQVHLRFTIFGK